MDSDYLPVINTHFTFFGGHQETVSSKWRWMPEEHPAFELIYIIAGQQKTIEETSELTLNAGEFTIIPVETRHTNYASGNTKMSYFCMHFDLDDPTFKYLLVRHYANRIIGQTDPEYAALKAEILKIIAMIKPTYALADELTLQINVMNVIMILIRSIKNQDELQAQQRDITQFMRCQKIAQDIKERLDEQIYHDQMHTPISVSEIIEKHHISQSYALKLFKKYYDETPQNYLINLKLSAAKGLLLQPDAQISDVSEKLMYSAPSHFTREFKKAFHMTPRAFIKENE